MCYFSKRWCRCVMPFSFHLVPTIGDLFITMSGLCHMGVCAQGVIVRCVIVLTSIEL